MRIVLAPLAEQDLQQACDFIAKDNPEAAERVLADILETLGMLATARLLGRPVTLRTRQKVLVWSHPPYRIYYRIAADELQVVRVYHQARRPIE